MAHKYNPFIVNDDRSDCPSDEDPIGDPIPLIPSDSDASSADEEEEDADASSTTHSVDDDPDFVGDFRTRRLAGMVRQRITTQARDAGFADADDLRMQVTLRRQHELRVPDRAFGMVREQLPGHLSGARWTRWRMGFHEHLGLCSKTRMEEITVTRTQDAHGAAAAAAPADATGTSAATATAPADAPPPAPPPRPRTVTVKITVYRALMAFVMNVVLLLQLYFAFAPPPDPVTPFLLCADGVGDASPGCPSKGKVYGMFLKQLSCIRPQSPDWLIPILFNFGSDAAGSLAWTFAAAGLGGRLVPRLLSRQYGVSGALTSIAIAFLGDFPACYATVGLLTAARQFPEGPGLVALWMSPLCWCCGAGGSDMYCSPERAAEYRADVARQIDRRSRMESRTGVPPGRVFYDPVHAVAVVFQSLLCDLCIYFQRLHTDYLHPVAAYILTLFAQELWDPFLVRKHEGRHGHKPFYSNDPAVVWRTITSGTTASELDALIGLHDVPWHPLPDGSVASPRNLWRAALRWLHYYIRGDADATSRAACYTEDVWRRMLSLSAPVPVGRACALDERPPFLPSIAAYGPASHAAFCTSARYIRWVDQVLPKWRSSGKTFLKIAAGIFLEHGMKKIRSDLADFNINTMSRKVRPMQLLSRAIERVLLARIMRPDPITGRRPPFVPGRPRKDCVNQAYENIPLSLIPLCLEPTPLPTV